MSSDLAAAREREAVACKAWGEAVSALQASPTMEHSNDERRTFEAMQAAKVARMDAEFFQHGR